MGNTKSRGIASARINPHDDIVLAYAGSENNDKCKRRKVAVVDKERWFKHLTGADVHLTTKVRIAPSPQLGTPMTLSNRKAHYSAGDFRLYSLGDVEAQLNRDKKSCLNFPRPVAVPIEIITCADAASKRYVDIGYWQSRRENKDALFQVESTVTGLVPDPFGATEAAHIYRAYMSNHTSIAGVAALSAGPAAIARVAIATTHQINFMSEVAEQFPARAGYIDLIGPTNAKCLPGDRSERKKLKRRIKFGYHAGVQITTGLKVNNTLEQVRDSQQVVDQIFCAVLDLGRSLLGRSNNAASDAEEKARFLLNAAYDCTYAAAIANRKTTLYMTLLGRREYANKKEWIFDALVRAHHKWGRHPANQLQKVALILPEEEDIYLPLFVQLKKHHIPYTWLEYAQGGPRPIDSWPSLYNTNNLSASMIDEAGDDRSAELMNFGLHLDMKAQDEAWDLYDRGKRILLGLGLKYDERLGYGLLLQAAALGHYWAQKDLTYFRSQRYEFNWERAASEYAVHTNDPVAYYNLGCCYYSAKGVSEDRANAVALWRKSAELGCVGAINSLAQCYYRGHGVEASLKKAVWLFSLAADRGYFVSQYNLANCLREGQVKMQGQQVAALYVHAASYGFMDAWQCLNALLDNSQAQTHGQFSARQVVRNDVPSLRVIAMQACYTLLLKGPAYATPTITSSPRIPSSPSKWANCGGSPRLISQLSTMLPLSPSLFEEDSSLYTYHPTVGKLPSDIVEAMQSNTQHTCSCLGCDNKFFAGGERVKWLYRCTPSDENDALLHQSYQIPQSTTNTNAGIDLDEQNALVLRFCSIACHKRASAKKTNVRNS